MLKNIELKVTLLCKSKSIKLIDLYNYLDITRQGYYNAFNNNTLKVVTLLKISEFLKTPMEYWFKDDKNSKNIMIGNNLVNGNYNNVQSNLKDCKNELDNALKRIKELEGIISMKDVLIEQMLRASGK